MKKFEKGSKKFPTTRKLLSQLSGGSPKTQKAGFRTRAKRELKRKRGSRVFLVKNDFYYIRRSNMKKGEMPLERSILKFF